MLRRTEAPGDEPGILMLIAAAMCSVTDCSRSAVFVLDTEHGVLRGSAAYGYPLSRVTALAGELRDVPLAAAAVDAGGPVRCRDQQIERCLPRSWVDGLRLTDPVFVPLVSTRVPVAFVLLDGGDVPDAAWPEARRKAAAYASVAGAALRTQLPHVRAESALAPRHKAATLGPTRPTPAVGTEAEPRFRFRRPEPVDQPDRPNLTEQELRVVRSVAEGLTNPEIGARLGLSRHTVKEYLSHAMRKLEASNRVEAVRRAGNLGILEGTHTVPLALPEDAAQPLTEQEAEASIETSDLKVPAVKIGRLRNAPEP